MLYLYVCGPTNRLDDAQRAVVLRFIDANSDLPFGDLYVDAPDRHFLRWNLRPEGKKLAKLLKRGDRLIAAAPEALGRDRRRIVEALRWLANRGIEVVFAVPADELEALLSEAPSLASRTRTAVQKLKASGRKWQAHAPLGFRWRYRRLCPWPAEQAELTMIAGMRDQGMSWRSIGSALIRSRNRPVRGGDWSVTGIRRRYRRAMALLKDVPHAMLEFVP